MAANVAIWQTYNDL